jgi:hypothetical protein
MTNETITKARIISKLARVREDYLNFYEQSVHCANVCRTTGRDSGFKNEAEYNCDAVAMQSVYRGLDRVISNTEKIQGEELSREDMIRICSSLDVLARGDTDTVIGGLWKDLAEKFQ